MIIYDTEYTSWKGAIIARHGWAGQHREVVQIAALRVQDGQSWENAETFDIFVKPVLNRQLDPYFMELTGITQEDVDVRGLDTATALAQFADFCGNELVYSNGQDINVIAETCGLQRIVMPMNPRQFHSLRPRLYQQLEVALGRSFDWSSYPSGRLYELLDLTLPTSQVHNALHDVYSIAATLTALKERGLEVTPDF